MQKQRSEPNPVHALISEYDQAFEEKFGTRAPVVRGKDHKLAKQLLDRYELDRLREWVWRFFLMEDAFIKQSGYTFGVFASCIGKVITTPRPERRNDKLSGLREFIDG
jgi:hypothetical protein